MSLTRKVLLALIAGSVIGAMANASGSESVIAWARAIEPIGTLWVNAIRMTVIPLVVASLVVAIAGAPDARIVGRIGTLSLIVFMVLLSLTAIVTLLAVPPIVEMINPEGWSGPDSFQRTVGMGAAAATLPKFSQWLIDLVPSNPIKAAVDGAMLPLIVFSVAFGAAATKISEAARNTILKFFGGIAEAMLKLMQFILMLAPIGVFGLAVPLATRVGAEAAGAVLLYIVMICVLCVLVGLLLYPISATVGRAPLAIFARAAAPAQVVAATSRSSLASLPAMIEGAEKHLGIQPSLARLFLPLSASTFRLGAVIVQIGGVLFLARLYEIELGLATLLTVGLTSVLTSFSVPAIAGGSIIVMVPVLMAAGVPVEGVGILLGIDVIPDIFRTALNITGHMSGATIVSRFAGPMPVDNDVLTPQP